MKSKMIKTLVALSISATAIIGSASLTASASEMTVATGVTTASSLHVRSNASTGSRIKGSLPRNSKIEITQLGSSWDKIKFRGGTGYVYNEYVSSVHKISNNSASNAVSYNAVVTASALNMRSGPSTGYGIQRTLPHNAKVGVISTSNGWAKINYNGNIGYVSLGYLRKTSDSSTSKPVENTRVAYTTASYLNIRTSPVSGSIITSVPNGTKVEVYSTSNGWAKVKVNGKTGYASEQYLRYAGSTSESKPSQSEDWVAKLNVAQSTNQLVTVQVSGTNAHVEFHKKSNGKWNKEFGTEGHVGYGGISSNRHEGDGSTPTGVYTFGTAFGMDANPGTAFSYHELDNHDWWCADANSDKFNTLQHRDYSNDDWSTAGGEHLVDHPTAYEYALSINFNNNRATASKGSAIFLHCDKGGSTAGCVAVPKDRMVQLLKELNPNAKIVISSTNGIYNY